jgi:hypothetical protein
MAEDAKPKLDNFTSKVVADPAKPQDTLLINGFLGASSEAGHTRIYTDPTLDNFVDVSNADIVHTEPVAKEQSPLGGHYIWVKKNAEIVSGMTGAEKTKAKFLEGPIAAQAAGVGGAAAALPVTVPVFVCHPTLVVQLCPTHLPLHCPSHAPFFCPSPIPILCGHTHVPALCPPTPFPHLCPTPVCPTLPQLCIPHLTVNQPHCVASGAFGCQPPFGGVGGGPVEAQAAFAQPAQAALGHFPNTILCPSVFVQCPHTVPVLHCFHTIIDCPTPFNCPSVPAHHCPTAPPFCLHTTLAGCNTVFQPGCIPVASPNCPPGTGDCPFGGLPGGGVINPQFGGFGAAQAANPQMAAFAAAPGAGAFPPTQLPAQCLTVAPSVCGCPSVVAPQCPSLHCTPACPTAHCTVPPQCPPPTPFCPTPHCTPQCPTAHCTAPPQCPPPTPLCPTPHCPTPHCPTPHCPTRIPIHCPSAVCTETLHCNPTPQPVHCPTPNMICPHPSVGFQCPSQVEICPTSSPIFCAAASPNCPPPPVGGPVEFQAAAMQGVPGAQAAAIHLGPSVFVACHPTVVGCPVSVHPLQCSVFCPPPRTFNLFQCFGFTPQCPIISAFCPPPQSIACNPGGFGGFNPGF